MSTARASLLERAGELAAIDGALAAAADGRGSLVVVEGPSGIGKTSLLAAARERADDRGLQTLGARGAELERLFPYGIVRQLLDPVLAGADDALRDELVWGPAERAVRVLGLGGAAGAGEEAADPFAVLHGLTWLVTVLAARQPVVLAVDDAHWADEASARFLHFLLPRLADYPVLVLAATWPEREDPGSGLAVSPAATVLRPRTLSPAAVAQLVLADTGAVPEPELVDAAVESTGGVPMLVRSLLDGLREEPAAEAATVEEVGARTARRWLALRLARLPEDAVALARAVAVLGASPLPLAAAVAGLDAEVATAAADRLVTAGLLAPGPDLAFAHAILRTGVLDGLDARARATLHRDAAAALTAAGASEEAVIGHLMLADPAGDPAVVARLRAGARAALAGGAAESAVRQLERALAEPPADSERGAVLLELGTAGATAGDPAALEHLGAAERAAADPGTRARATLARVGLLGQLGRFAEGVAAADATAASLDGAEPGLATLLEVAALNLLQLDAETAGASADRLRNARSRAGEPGAPRELLGIAAIAALKAGATGEAVALARRALETPGPYPRAADLPWWPYVAAALIWGDAWDDAEPMLAAAREEATRLGDGYMWVVASVYGSMLAHRRGALAEAESAATAALAPDLPQTEIFGTLAQAALVQALVDRGELAAAADVLAPVWSKAEVRRDAEALLLHARMRLRHARRDLDGAAADGRRLGALLGQTGGRSPCFIPWRSDTALALLALGERPEAAALAEAEVALAREAGAARAEGVALRAAGLAAEGSAAEACLERAVAVLESTGARLEHARALADLGSARRRAGRRADAREPLEAALELARGCGAAPLADVVETELAALGARARSVVLTGVDQLTPSERRVAELARDGLTNREIAQALFVTPRTVEGHLSGVFRKLDLRSRNELARVL